MSLAIRDQVSDQIVRADFPEKLAPLFDSVRYKILYGGRGGCKSWGIARYLLIAGSKRPLRILCARELQKSIKDSVHRLLSDQIISMGLSSFYTILKNSITGKNGTEFFFEGLRHNSAQIKSYEGIDKVWVEEAVFVSKSSWNFLIPTIRKEGSEILVSYNPELEEDETHQRFVINPPTNSVVVEMSWRDNPWFTAELRQEMEDLKERDYQDYLTVWEGQCRQAVEGAIYAEELRAAQKEGRITSVPYDRALPVHTFWDLGWADNTSIWFIQKVGFEFRVIDFYQNSRKKIQHYMQILQEKGYIYGTDHLPHDGKAQQLVGKSTQEYMENLGRNVTIVPAQNVTDGLNATRTMFEVCWFDREKCADGLQALRRYRFEINPDTGRESKVPLHDINSHAADAFKTFGTAPDVMWDVLVEKAGYGTSNKVVSEFDPHADRSEHVNDGRGRAVM